MSPCHGLRCVYSLSWLHMSCKSVAWSLQTIQADTTGASREDDSLRSTYTILWVHLKDCRTRKRSKIRIRQAVAGYPTYRIGSCTALILNHQINITNSPSSHLPPGHDPQGSQVCILPMDRVWVTLCLSSCRSIRCHGAISRDFCSMVSTHGSDLLQVTCEVAEYNTWSVRTDELN